MTTWEGFWGLRKDPACYPHLLGHMEGVFSSLEGS